MTGPNTRTDKGRQGVWHASDAPSGRQQLFSPGMIAGFGIALCLGLLLVFPYKTLEDKLARDNAPYDSLTVEYLKVFVRAEPGAIGLRMALAQRLIKLGTYAEARTALQPLMQSEDEAVRLQVRFLELEMLTQETFAQQDGTSQRVGLHAQVRAQLLALLNAQLSTEQLAKLGRTALALGETKIATQAYQRLVANDKNLPLIFYAEAAATMLSLGEYSTCAALYFQAMQLSQDLSLQRSYFLKALQALQAASLFDEALRAAEKNIGSLAHDFETLMFLTRLAQAANRPDVAEYYARRMLKLSLLQQLPQAAKSSQIEQATQFGRAASTASSSPLAFYFSAMRGDGGEPMPAQLRIVSATADDSLKTGALRAFDDVAYALAYDVFLANRNLTDAYKLAQSAVRQRPELAIWRKRLAEVSEWTGAPQEALLNWQQYAKLSKEEAAWDAVLRLAESLHDQSAMRLALEHKLALEPHNAIWLERLLATHEAEGQAELALQLLRQRLTGAAGKAMGAEQRRRETERLAEISLRAGQDEEALQTWRKLQAEFGPNSAYALRIANLLYQQARIDDAYVALKQGVSGAQTNDIDFWRAYAEVARLLQDDTVARNAYQTLLAADQQNEADLSNLISLLDATQPRAAAQVAEFAFDKTGNAQFLVQAFNYHYRTADTKRAQALLLRLTPQQLTSLERNAAFLAARAALKQVAQDANGAVKDWRAALLLQPTDVSLRANLIWSLIVVRDAAGLSQALRLWASDAEVSADLWGPFAAANMSLNRQDQALHWFRKSGFVRDDYLWLMSYAEALDATSQPDLAWRIRRKAWQDLRKPEVLAALDPSLLVSARDRLASLAPLFAGGDETQSVMAALLRADLKQLTQPAKLISTPQNGQELLARIDAAVADDGKDQVQSLKPDPAALFAKGRGHRPLDDQRLSATVRELALAYALNRDAHDLARAWLASRYAKQLDKPLWGELALLLQAGDRARFDHLLDTLSDWLPMYDRIEAARMARRPALAETLAFDQLARLPADEQLHLRLTNMSTNQPARFQANTRSITDGALKTSVNEMESTVNLATGLRLSLRLNQGRHRTTDRGEIGAVPRRDDEAVLTLRKLTETGFVAASVTHRVAGANTSGLRFEYLLSLNSQLSLAGKIGWRQPASESALLRAGAMRSGTEQNLTYAFTRTEYASLGINWYRYLSQQGTQLGSGRGFSAEVGSHLRLEYPNLTLRASVAHNSYNASGKFDAQIAQLAPLGSNPANYSYIPIGSPQFGLSLGLGTVIEDNYSRGMRPFAEVGLTYAEDQGLSYNWRGGLVGSVVGQDMLMLRLQRNGATSARPEGLQEIGLHYKWFY